MKHQQRGRTVPSSSPAPHRTDRIAHATALYEAHQDAVHAAVAELPSAVSLADGRVLTCVEHKPYRKAYRCSDGMLVLASIDATEHGLLRHISVSYAKRDPRWSDLRQLRDAFFAPDIDVIQVLPREGQYVNVHQHCFHLFEAPAVWQGGWFV